MRGETTQQFYTIKATFKLPNFILDYFNNKKVVKAILAAARQSSQIGSTNTPVGKPSALT
jgi:hypothetical protein